MVGPVPAVTQCRRRHRGALCKAYRLLVPCNKPSILGGTLIVIGTGGNLTMFPLPFPVTHNGLAHHRATWLPLCRLAWAREHPHPQRKATSLGNLVSPLELGLH